MRPSAHALTKKSWTSLLAGLLVAGSVLAAQSASADTFGLGSAENYAILASGGGHVTLSGGGVSDAVTGLTGTYVVGNIGLGTGGQYTQSAGTVSGAVSLGAGAAINISGINSSVINDGTSVSGGGGATISGGINQTAATGSAIAAALNTAGLQSAHYAGLAATQTFSGITGNTTITGVSGLNVIDVNGNIILNNQTLTLKGPADAQFVFNVTGQIIFNGGSDIGGVNVAETLTGGVTPMNVLFNQIGPGSTTTFTNNALAYGIFLNPTGNPITLSGGEVVGEVIGGTITLASSSQVDHPVTTSVPEPPALFLLAPALALAVGYRRKRLPNR